MNIEEFLRALKDCPDERLEEQLGVVDNYPLLFHADYHGTIRSLLRAEEFTLDGQMRCHQDAALGKETTRTPVLYLPKGVRIQLLDYVTTDHTTAFVDPAGEGEVALHRDRQLREYNMALLLHKTHRSVQDLQPDAQRIEQYQHRAIADTVEALLQYAMRKGIPACVPWAVSHTPVKEGKAPFDLSPVTYFTPAAAPRRTRGSARRLA